MLTINLFDSNFPQQSCSVSGKTAQRVQYVRNQMEWSGITLFVDQQMFSPMVDEVKSSYKIGWLQEGKELRPHHYEMSKQVREKFDFILTYDSDLMDFDSSKYRFAPRGGVWAPKGEWGMHEKTKHVSMILSEKYQTSGHKLRHEIADAGLNIDIYGAKGTEIGSNKAIAYKDYRYAVIVEASREYNLFTEHLLDCLAFGTIPLYWGCPNIGLWFNTKGFLQFRDIDELRTLLPICTAERYDRMYEAAAQNLRRIEKYEITDDWMAQIHFEPLIGKMVGAA
jgi:hypothetical protein